jgi:pilus assembly protein CpaC
MPKISAGPTRLQSLPYSGLGAAPNPNPDVARKYSKYVAEFKDPLLTLDLVVGRTRLMMLTSNPTRLQVADESVASYTVLSPRQISLMGRSPGVTILTLWFTDPATKQEEILTYHVRVVPDPVAKEQLDRVYKALAVEINRAFPNSVIQLQLVGDKLIVSGHCKDVADATKILQVVRANAPAPTTQNAKSNPTAQIPVDRSKAVAPTAPPGVEEYLLEANQYIVNLLQINGEQQVMLRVTVAEVNRAAARSIGVNFSISNSKGLTVFANNTGSIATGGQVLQGLNTFGGGANNALNQNLGVVAAPGVALGAGGFNNLPVALDNGQVRLAISALKVLQYARSLAEPNLVTMNGQTANFRAGGEFPVPIVTGNTLQGLQGVSFIPYGVHLSFTPYITDRDRIRLVLNGSVSSKDLAAGVTNFGGAAVPSLTTRDFNTTVEMREGQTLAIAGLIQNNIGAEAHRIPGIGELPVLSRLLGFDTTTAGEQELVVLITPELVHPLDCNEKRPLPGADIFEPGDCEFYIKGRLESHVPADYRTAVRTDCMRLKMARQLEQNLLIGPHGHDAVIVEPK